LGAAPLVLGVQRSGPERFFFVCGNEEFSLVKAALVTCVDFVLFLLLSGADGLSNCSLNVTGGGFLLRTNAGLFALSAFTFALASCLAFCHSLKGVLLTLIF